MNTVNRVLLVILGLVGEMSFQGLALAQQDFNRTPAYEVFGEPGSEFFIHAYMDLTFWDYEKDHKLPLQFHGAQDGSAQFSNYFTALFIGREISDTLSMLSQIHFHLNPIPGQVGPTVVIPQAKITWEPTKTEKVRIHFGRFYSPFGNTNDDVQTPLNRFVSQPYTGYTAIPFHWFDTGIQLDFSMGFTDGVGVNITVALTNGPQRIVPDIPPNFQELDDRVIFPNSSPGGALLKSSFTDYGGNVIMRLGVFPGLTGFDFGVSYASGTLREDPLLIADDDGPGLPANSRTMTGQYAADWNTVGIDVQYYFGRFSFRGDWNRSTEELIGANSLGANPTDREIERSAWRAQMAYHLFRNIKGVFEDIWLTFRADTRDPDRDLRNNADLRRYTIGVNLAPHEQVMFKLNYERVDEVDGAELDNNGALFQVVANF